jgi:acyl-CoA thioester hydrolase
MKRRFEIKETLDNDFVLEARTDLKWHRSTFRVLYADTDKAGPVYHANYLKYFEIGRAGLIRSSSHSYRDIEALGYFHPIVDMRVQFESYAEYDDLLGVYARPMSLAPVKFSYEYIVRNDAEERLLVHGYTVHCCIDGNRRVCPVDPVTAAMFAEFGITK